MHPPFLSLCDSYHHVYLWKQYDAIFRNIVIASVAYLQQRNDEVSSDCVREVRDDVAFHSLFLSLFLFYSLHLLTKKVDDGVDVDGMA